jgi:hypothetical protein
MQKRLAYISILFLILFCFSCKNGKKNESINSEIENIKRPKKTIIRNLEIDTTKAFGIWTQDPNGPHADFWLTANSFYVVDYDGDGEMPYILDKNEITIFYNDFVQKGRITSIENDILKIKWDDIDVETEYVKFKELTKFNTLFYSEVGACPFEGCTYGEWSTNDIVKVLKEPKLNSDIIGNIPADTEFNAISGKIEIVPGVAFKVKEIPSIGYTESETSKIEYNQPIYILHYVGEGFNKINQNNEFGFLQIPSDKNMFIEYKSNYDWLKIEKYPTEFKWWAKIEYLDLKGWILVNNSVSPLNRYSL